MACGAGMVRNAEIYIYIMLIQLDYLLIYFITWRLNLRYDLLWYLFYSQLNLADYSFNVIITLPLDFQLDRIIC